ncbi:hypothetical protein [Marinifilum sp.]|uniref:hypothetical protein n=1 Tax=Marinifilum sp. TaxID=2033137 RepID=UPI003BAA5B0A
MKKLLHFTLALVAALMLSTISCNAGNEDSEIEIRNSNSLRVENIKVSTNGNIEFNDDYTDVKAMSDDAYIKISMVSFGMKRKLYIHSEEGRILYRYMEGSREVDFEPKGREWMKKMLPDIVRSSGMDLENRVNKVYKKSGISGFLKELEETRSDYYRSNMVRYLLKNNSLNKNELRSLIREFPYRIKSDYELSRIYKKYNPIFIHDPEISEEFFKSLEELSSNYELSQVLKSVYRQNELNLNNFNRFIDAMDDISSSYEKSNLIKMALADNKLTKAQLDVLLDEVEEIGSNYEKSQIIKSIIKVDGLSSSNANKIIELTGSISSDYEMGLIINSMIHEEMLNQSNLDEFIDLLDNISSDYTFRRILNQLITYDELGDDRFDFLLDVSDEISSSYELSRFYKALAMTGGMTKKQQLKLINKSGNISSNYELANFLKLATIKMDIEDNDIRDALIEAAQGIESEFEYGKVMKAIYSKNQPSN